MSQQPQLPSRTAQVLRFIQHYFAQHGYPPSLGEILDHCAMARISLEKHLTQLEEFGLVRWTPRFRRGITLLIE
jgi:SOS-response transcriptional repressor LexA